MNIKVAAFTVSEKSSNTSGPFWLLQLHINLYIQWENIFRIWQLSLNLHVSYFLSIKIRLLFVCVRFMTKNGVCVTYGEPNG